MYALQIAVYEMSSHKLIPLKKIILEKVTGPHLDEKFPHLTWNLLWFSQESATFSCPVADAPSPFTHILPVCANVVRVLSFVEVYPSPLLGGALPIFIVKLCMLSSYSIITLTTAHI